MIGSDELYNSFLHAIIAVGMNEFKKCSFFGRNCEDVTR